MLKTWHPSAFYQPLVLVTDCQGPRQVLLERHVKPLVRKFAEGNVFFPTLPMWTVQLNEKYYGQAVAGYAVMYKYLNAQDPGKRFVHEVIPRRVPIKVFVDLDYKGVMPRGVNFVRLLIDTLTTYFSVLSEREVVVLCASDSSKYSKHIVFQYLVPGVHILEQIMRDFSEYLLETLDEHCQMLGRMLDLNVYKAGGSFRVYGARKVGNDRILHVEHRPCDRMLRADVFYKSLLCCYMSAQNATDAYALVPRFHYEHDMFLDIEEVEQIGTDTFGNDVEPDNCGWSDTEIYQLKRGVVQFFKHRKRLTRVSVTHHGQYLRGGIQPGLVCPYLGRVHKHNRTYFSLSIAQKPSGGTLPAGFYLSYKCADTDCPNNWFGRHSIATVACMAMEPLPSSSPKIDAAAEGA